MEALFQPRLWMKSVIRKEKSGDEGRKVSGSTDKDKWEVAAKVGWSK